MHLAEQSLPSSLHQAATVVTQWAANQAQSPFSDRDKPKMHNFNSSFNISVANTSPS